MVTLILNLGSHGIPKLDVSTIGSEANSFILDMERLKCIISYDSLCCCFPKLLNATSIVPLSHSPTLLGQINKRNIITSGPSFSFL